MTVDEELAKGERGQVMEWIARDATTDDALRAVDRLRKGKPGEHGWHYDLDVIETVLRRPSPTPEPE